MQFDPNNKVVQLCTQGMDMEAKLRPDEAKDLFQHAWEEASTDFEKFTAAHYVARHQATPEEKLKWDETSLEFALKINDPSIAASLPSLYLNIAKGFEDLGDRAKARENYHTALSYQERLPGSEYGKIIRDGIKNGIARVLP